MQIVQGKYCYEIEKEICLDMKYGVTKLEIKGYYPKSTL